VTDAVDFQMQLAKPAHFGDPFPFYNPHLDQHTPVNSTPPTLQAARDLCVFLIKNLPRHLVRLVTLPQAEGAAEVAGQQIHLLDAGKQGLVDGLLVSSAAAVDLLLL
jgi:hypothetical protein